jgi:hypothetical protein
MKIIITENLYPKLRIVNGTIGYIQNILINKSQWIQQNHSMHPPTNVYVDLNKFIEKMPLYKRTLEGLPKNVVSIILISEPFNIITKYHNKIFSRHLT